MTLNVTPLLVRIVTGATISAAILALCVFSGVKFKERAEQAIYRETENISRVLMSRFDETLDNIKYRLFLIGPQLQDTDLQGEISVDMQLKLHSFLKNFAGQPSITGPSIFNKNGMLVASGEIYPVPNYSLADDIAFRVYSENTFTSNFYISPSVVGRFTHRWSLHFTSPIRTKSGEFAGVIMFGYTLSSFSDLYDKLKVTEHSSVALNGKDGLSRIRIRNGALQYDAKVTPKLLAYPRVLNGEKEGTVYAKSQIDGIVRLGTFVASDKSPFYVLSSYDEAFFRSQYMSFYFVLGAAWLAISIMIASSIIFISRLINVRQQAHLDIMNAAGAAAVSERQNILADMHDGIGASLVSLLAHLNSDKVDVNDLRRRIDHILVELRCFVDVIEPIDGDVGLILSGVRHRLGKTLEISKLHLTWQVSDLPRIAEFTTRDGLAVKLIVLEALSNVLHHSHAKNLSVEARHDIQTGTIVIAITDDGRGFSPAHVSGKSRGLSNLKKRAKNISTGATITINSAPDMGTAILLKLTVPR